MEREEEADVRDGRAECIREVLPLMLNGFSFSILGGFSSIGFSSCIGRLLSEERPSLFIKFVKRRVLYYKVRFLNTTIMALLHRLKLLLDLTT
jgi:hypothetical protein